MDLVITYAFILMGIGAVSLPLGLWLRSREKRAERRRGFPVLPLENRELR